MRREFLKALAAMVFVLGTMVTTGCDKESVLDTQIVEEDIWGKWDVQEFTVEGIDIHGWIEFYSDGTYDTRLYTSSGMLIISGTNDPYTFENSTVTLWYEDIITSYFTIRKATLATIEGDFNYIFGEPKFEAYIKAVRSTE